MRLRTLCVVSSCLLELAAGAAPNVVLVMADDVSAKDFSLYGSSEIQTPNLDQMAAGGMYFQTAWSTPICSPSRAMIMTGKYANKTKAYHNNIKLNWNLARDHLTIGEMMKQAGYRTAFAGKVQMDGNFREEYGFDEAYEWADWDGFDGPVERWEKGKLPKGGWYDRAARYWHPSITINGKGLKTTEGDYGPDILVDHINRFIESNKGGPFFVYYPMLLPHKSWDFERNKSGYLPTPVRDENGQRTGGKSNPTLKANVEYMDYLVGEIRTQVEKLGIAENTVIIYTSDNGTAGYGKGVFTRERGARVPFVVWGPGAVKAQGASPELIDFSDVLPTLAELAGYAIEPAEGIDGVSFAPLLRGDNRFTRDWIGVYFGPFRLIRTKEWLLDGQNRLFDCRVGRDDAALKNVTDSSEPEVLAAREKLEALRDQHFPLDDFRENAEIKAQWESYQTKGGPFIRNFVP